MRFKSKPQEVEAIQWTGDNFDEVLLFAKNRVELIHADLGPEKQVLNVLAGDDGSSGWVPVPPSGWVVRWPDDERDYWPVDDERFQARYEPV